MHKDKLTKNLIPHQFFITKGFGVDSFEKHAGAYHMALYDAGIADYNIQTYSSVLPPTAKLVSLDEIDLDPHGTELKTIMSCEFGEFGEFISAGIIYAWMYKDENFDHKYGGLVCEVHGKYTIETLEERLFLVLNNLFNRTYKEKGLYLGDPTLISQGGSIPNDARYGCALTAMCFINYSISEK
jgi:arginine decarboxylase